MAPSKRQVKARRHLLCDHCHSLVDFALSGCGKSWSETTEEGFTFQCLGCWKVDCLTAELAKLTDLVKGMERGGRMIARKTNGERTTENMPCMKETVEKVTVEKEGGTRGQEMIEVDATGGKTKGRKELRVDMTKRKMSGRKETGKKGTESITVQSKSVCERMSVIASPYIFRRVFHLYYTEFGIAYNASDTSLRSLHTTLVASALTRFRVPYNRE